jgi:hypothetical protein
MFQSRVRTALFPALLSLTALLGLCAAPAQAAIYSGRWDPAFGSLFPNLGWKGSATFIVPDACLGMTGSFANAAPGCGGGGMQVLDASLSFYDSLADPTGSHVLQVLTPGNAPVVVGMTLASSGGVTSLLGADTGYFLGVPGNIPQAEFNGHDYYFHLILHGDQAALFYTLNANDTPGCASDAFGPPDPTKCGYSATPAHIVFTQAIPEPSTYALFGLGLGALLTLRRRVKASSPPARAGC